MLWVLVCVLILIWAAGLVVNIGGGFIHLLLVVAVIVVLYNLVTVRRI